jgi:hypothetical protein
MMWRKPLLFLLFVSCSLCVIAAVEAEPWYLIRESELQSIEAYKTNSEAEKQTWLSQVQKLSRRAGNLEAESVSLNSHLQHQRELNRQLTLSFNEYESAQLALLSSKNGEIAKRDREIAELKLDKKTSKGQRNIAILVAVGLLALYLVKLRFKIP